VLLVEWLLLAIVIALAVLIVVAAVRSVRITTIHDYERGLRFRQGRLVGLVDPGVHLTVGPLTELRGLDVRPAMVPVEGQEILTADGVPAKVSLVARYVVGDPVAAVTLDADFRRTTYLVLQLGLRQAVSRRTLEENLAARAALGGEVREIVAGRLAAIGVELLDVEVRDVMLPGELKRAYASVIAARKEGEASLERARAETAALRGLANAGRTLADNPGLLQLRILQELGASSGNTVVFGAPDATVPTNGRRPVVEAPVASDGERPISRAPRAPRP
jgi:regulator of protease activity HflC (stomatin/prohibitin superfamily)